MNNLILISHLIGPLDADNSAVPDQFQDALGSGKSELNTLDGNKFKQWKSVASVTAKLFLRGAKESADVFPPLKSVVGGLCFIVDNFEVCQLYHIYYPQHLWALQQTNANNQAVKSLAPRVTALFASLCQPVHEGYVKEEQRRKELQQ